MKYLLLFGLIIAAFSSVAQTKEIMRATDEEYELITLLLYRQKPYLYLDRTISHRNNPSLMRGKYLQQMRFYRTADSICEIQKDTLLLKTYCPVAFNLERYEGLLNEQDFAFLESTYPKESVRESILDIERIERDCMIQKHSDKYYEYQEGDRSKLFELSEYPGIEINQIYFTENRQVAVIGYTLRDSPTNSSTGFFLFKKMKDVWWNPIGNLKF